MIKSCVTISIVEQARSGPFVFHDDVAAGCASAAELGFDAVELFAPSADAIASAGMNELLQQHNLKLAAVGTGAGMVIHGLSLSTDDESQRASAIDFVKGIIEAGAEFSAPAIIGSMQGRWTAESGKDETTARLRDSLRVLSAHAAEKGTKLIYEPLNRYETNLAMTMAEGCELIAPVAGGNVVLLADLFHMNIEEANLANAIRDAGSAIGHVHFVDSNRQAAGRGHMSYVPIAEALRAIDFDGYASAEAFAIPDSVEAARQTIATFRSVFAA